MFTSGTDEGCRCGALCPEPVYGISAPPHAAEALGRKLCPACIGTGESITAQSRVVRTEGYSATTVQARPSDTSPMTELALNGRRCVAVEATSAEEAPLRAGAAALRSIDPSLPQIADALPGDGSLLCRPGD